MSLEDEVKSDSPVAVLGVGDRLRTERESKGMTIDDVSQTLKISRRVLEQVEANAWGQLPGHTFARGVVRGYAKLLQLDAESLLRALEDAPLPKPPLLELPKSTRAAIPMAGQTEKRDRIAMIFGVVLVATAVMAYFLIPDDFFTGSPVRSAAVDPVKSEAPAVVAPTAVSASVVAPAVVSPSGPVAVSSPVAESSAPNAVAVAQPSTSPIVNAAGVPVANAQSLVIQFVEASWVEIRDRNGVLLLSENVASGNERIVNGTAPISLALGNAEGVKVTFRGKAVDLVPHTRQKVARLSLD